MAIQSMLSGPRLLQAPVGDGHDLLQDVARIGARRGPGRAARGGVPGARGVAARGAAGGGRLTRSRRAWRARADVIANCRHLCGARALNQFLTIML